jgi:hypothetical protein
MNHAAMDAGATARAAGGEREEAAALAATSRTRDDLRFRASVAGATGIVLSVCLCVLAVAGLDYGRGQHGELEEVKRVRTGMRLCAWGEGLSCMGCAAPGF